MEPIQARKPSSGGKWKRAIAFGAVLAAGLMLPRSAGSIPFGESASPGYRPDLCLGTLEVRDFQVGLLTEQTTYLRRQLKRLRRENARLKAELQALKPGEAHGHHRLLQ